MHFEFITDAESQAFCERIVEAMTLLYDINPDQGCELLNKRWRGSDLRDPSNGGIDEYFWLIYHEDARNWAYRVGNPEPISDGHEKEAWKAREDKAELRIRAFHEAGLHDWLGGPFWPY